ncbi:MAG: hypothetical protein E7I01_21550, partial [Aeromonas sp.]
AKIGAKYKYYTDGFKKKLEEKDEEIGVIKNQRNEQQKKHRAFKKEYYSQKKETEKAVKEKKEKSKEVYFLNNENKELKKNNDILEVENLSLREENKELQQYKITSKKMRDRFPDEYKAMEAEISKPRPKGESYEQKPTQQNVLQEEDRKNPRFRM